MLCDFIDMIHSADRILDIQTERVTESRPEAARVGEGQDGARDARGTSEGDGIRSLDGVKAHHTAHSRRT